MECQKSTIAVIATATTIAMAKTIFLIIGARSAPAGRSYTPTFRVGGRGALSIESSTIAGGAPVAGRPPAFGSRCDHARRLAAVTIRVARDGPLDGIAGTFPAAPYCVADRVPRAIGVRAFPASPRVRL